jgi:GrpB-like predicted nucleotidyltransferase (UPF0157 family)
LRAGVYRARRKFIRLRGSVRVQANAQFEPEALSHNRPAGRLGSANAVPVVPNDLSAVTARVCRRSLVVKNLSPIPGFAAESGLASPPWSYFALPARTGPKDSGDVLPYIKIVDYDSRWPAIYTVEEQRIRQLIGSTFVRVEHFGSTAVPRICAKPVIDILAGLADWRTADQTQNALYTLDYRYIAGLEDWRILGRTGSPAFRLHLVPYGSYRWRGFLALRDHLRENPKDAAEYCSLKRKLAVTHMSNRIFYNKAKREFLDRMGDLARRHILASRLVSREGSQNPLRHSR